MKRYKRIISRAMLAIIVIAMMNVFTFPPLNAKASDVYASVSYRTHCQSYGWLSVVSDGSLSGTSGEAKRLEAIEIDVDSNLEGSIEYSVHCQTYGWMDPVADGSMAGTSGESKRLEAITINLTGQLKEYYDVVYRVHCQTYGWLDWVKNGESAGTSGQSKRLEAIEIKLIKKSDSKSSTINYSTHVQTYGWMDYVANGKTSGTSGESKRLEGIKINVDSSPYTGGITYRVHCQTYGWLDWVSNNAVSGTTGEAKRLEAIQIKLTGELQKAYDVYYRVHSQTYGWLDWAKNGNYAGTSGLSKRLEAIQIKLVKKGGKAPGNVARPYVTQEILNQEALASDPANKDPDYQGEPTDSKKIEDIINSSSLKAVKTNDAEIDKRVEKILSEIIDDSMSTYEKTVAIYNWINNNNTYYKFDPGTYRKSYVSQYDTWCAAQCYSVLFKGYGSCVNYGAAFVVMTRAIGLESYKVGGKVKGSGGGMSEHYWAVINIHGTLYNFDPQLGDQAAEQGWGSAYDYFCKTDSEFKGSYEFVDVDGVPREDYIKGFNYFKLR